MLILRPVGRGNWATVQLQVSGRRAPLPVEVHPGQRVQLAGQWFRIVTVQPMRGATQPNAPEAP